MDIFVTLFLKILPLYLIIFLGFISGRFLKIRGENISKLLIYIISPVVILNGVLKTGVNLANILMPLTMFILACTICLLAFSVARKIWKESTANIFALSSGTGNTGYFGIPVAAALLGQDAIGILIYLTLGLILFENTLGFYITARGNFTPKQSLRKVLQLPTLYGFICAVLLSLWGYHPQPWLTDLYDKFLGTYSVLGMMLIGISIGNSTKLSWDGPFTFGLFIVRFLVWPLLTWLAITLDASSFHIFSPLAVKVMLLLSIVPLAANTVAFAAELNAEPDKAALTVLLSTLFALFYIPMVTVLFMS